MTDKECKHCEHFDLFTNICLIDNKKCYEDQKCLREEECKNYEDCKWEPYFTN